MTHSCFQFETILETGMNTAIYTPWLLSPAQSCDHARLLCLSALSTAPTVLWLAGGLGAVRLPFCVLLQLGSPCGRLLLTRSDQAAAWPAAQHPDPQPLL